MSDRPDSQQSSILECFSELPIYGVSLEFWSDDWVSVSLFESYAGTEIGRAAVKKGELGITISMMRIAASVFDAATSTDL